MTATLIQSPDRVILKNISWHTYQSLVIDFEHELQVNEYKVVHRSIALSPLQASDFIAYLSPDKAMGENSRIRQFRLALRKLL
jgi:hypothetical protein